ncbi:MAG: hypothetical protein U9R64_06310, partial [Pseudomonadota bacterium]|nr:hypothetical protein [Pseudomonadota bacterium]
MKATRLTARTVRWAMLAGSALSLGTMTQAMARDEAAAPEVAAAPDATPDVGSIIVTGAKTTRSA